MPGEPRSVFSGCAPSALFSHWTGTLRAAMTIMDKDDIGSAEVEHVDHRRSEKGAVNALLVFSCIVFGAASFIFGYDDKIISPLAALPPFVSIREGLLASLPVVQMLTLILRSQNSKALTRKPVHLPSQHAIKIWSSLYH